MSDRMGEEVARNARSRSLDRALADLAAMDPEVREAGERLDDATRSILSTSALLRQTQQDLAASQADLTRALEERDGLADTLALRTGQLNASRRFVAEARREGDLLKAELASARAELQQLRAQLAAHPDGGERP